MRECQHLCITQFRRPHTADGLSAPFPQQKHKPVLLCYLHDEIWFQHQGKCDGEKSFHPHHSETQSVMNGLILFGIIAVCLGGGYFWLSYVASTEREEKEREREREWWLSRGERSSQNSPGRLCVRSGALGPFGWLALNGCPGEVTRLIENRLRGEGNAFALRLAPWPTVQRLPWQLWNPTYLSATLWRERVERLSE